MRNNFFKYAVILLVAVCCVQAARGQRVKAVPDADSARGLSIGKANDLPEGDVADRIETDGSGNLL
jgi:hypothetical protein